MILSEIKINPDNPQKFDDLTKLENSIKEFPKMMELRPLVYDPVTKYVLGGNKRLICLHNLDYKEIPDNWAISAETLTEDEKKRFIIADNVGFGEWDEEKLSDWDEQELNEWGLNVDFEKVEEINTGDENSEWADMPDFVKGDNDIKVILYFNTELEREVYIKDNNIEITNKMNNQWISRI